MSGLENLQQRLKYRGGNQQNRMFADKVKSLKRALLYSYQAGTIVMRDGREFRALINPSKLNVDYDIKEISMPYKDVCLNRPQKGKTSDGEVDTFIHCGQVIYWKETRTFWLPYLQALEERAYFRAEMKRCDYVIEIEGKRYHVWAQGPTETRIEWNQKSNSSWNDLNYSLELMITKDHITSKYFKRFANVKFMGKNWEVQTVDTLMGDGVIQVHLKEDFSNTIEDEQKEKIVDNPINKQVPYIDGPDEVEIYSKDNVYEIKNIENGVWKLEGERVRSFSDIQDNIYNVEVTGGKSGSFMLIYTSGDTRIEKQVKIKSF